MRRQKALKHTFKARGQAQFGQSDLDKTDTLPWTGPEQSVPGLLTSVCWDCDQPHTCDPEQEYVNTEDEGVKFALIDLFIEKYKKGQKELHSVFVDKR